MIDIARIANLAKLTVKEPLLSKLHKQLEEILEFVSKLQKINTAKVPPTSQVTGLINVLREDEIDTTRMFTQEQALSNAPDSYNGFFKVPYVWS